MTLVDGSLESRLCIRVNWTYFRYLLRFRNYDAKCVELGCFRKGIDLCTQILPGQGCSPSTILVIRKLDTGLPDGEDCITLRSLVLTLLECDGRTDGFAVAYSTSIAERCENYME